MQARTKLIKSLEEQIEATNDPQLKADLTRQLTKVVTKPARRGRPRKPEATAPTKSRSIREKYTGSVYEQMSDGDLVCWHLVFEIEKRQRMGFLKNRAERTAFVAEVLGSLTEEERAAYEVFCTEEAHK
jgi:hypothetical protein